MSLFVWFLVWNGREVGFRSGLTLSNDGRKCSVWSSYQSPIEACKVPLSIVRASRYVLRTFELKMLLFSLFCNVIINSNSLFLEIVLVFLCLMEFGFLLHLVTFYQFTHIAANLHLAASKFVWAISH